MIDHGAEGGHAVNLQDAVKNNVVPRVHGEKWRGAEIRDHSAGHRCFAVAVAAEPGK
jgi:hypothetical protein